MSHNINNVVLVGQVAREPKTGVSESGRKWAFLSLVLINEHEGKEYKTYIDVQSFNDTAIDALSKLKGGEDVLVTGRLATQKKGETYRTVVNAMGVATVGIGVPAQATEEAVPF